MPDPHAPRRLPLSLEGLEARELPTAGPWLVEPFQRGRVGGLPTGWTQWASDHQPAFRVEATAPGLGDQGRLVSEGRSSTTARAWLSAPFAANVETSAAVFLNTTVPIHLFVRGKELGTSTPSYYAVAVTRGAEVQLLKVVRGQATVLGSVRSDDYISNRWVTVTIRAEGDRLQVLFHRGDTNQYLQADGTWTRRPTVAVAATDRSLQGSGQVGFTRPARAAGTVALDSLRVGAPQKRVESSILEERFSRGTGTGLPAGWSQWSGPGPASFRTFGDETLRIDGTSATAARAWINQPTAPDAQISSSIFVDSLVPAGLFARGSNLNTSRPTYYALTVNRGVEVKLCRVVAGTVTELGTLRSKEWLSGQWVQASLVLSGDQLRVQLYRSDTGQYLRPDGSWGLSPAWAMSRTDGAIRSGGRVGLTRGTGYAGQLVFDNFIVTTAPARGAPPAPIPNEGDKPTAPRPPGEDLPGPVVNPPTPAPSPPPVPTPSNPALPAVGRHYDWIRLANLAYYGTPLGAFEQSLLRNSIDLVIPNLNYLDDVAKISPQTPQFVYTNVSNIYLGLLTDWNEFADRNGHDREGAFYHVTRATPFNGLSASSVPVNRFWGVYRGDGTTWENLTGNARNDSNSFAFPTAGRSLALGYLEKFREINIDLTTAAAGNWAAKLEYVAAVDAQGRPTLWKPLTTLSDSTSGLRRDGRVVFDPPRDWVPSSLGGMRLYMVRFQTVSDGTAPVVRTVLGRDFTAGGRIPAFDFQADRDGDGYLNDTEYANRRSGLDARFVYESRLFYPNYGPMRFATNVSDPGFRAWVTDYHSRFVQSNPLARGFFVDNSIGRLAVDPTGLKERLEGYSSDYGTLLGALNQRLASSGRWVIANTVGANSSADAIVRQGVSYLEEFALRPLSANHVQFDDLAATLFYRRQLSGGRAYEILDSLPTNGVDATDPRVQLGTLAMYYTLADPNVSFLMVNGGNEPASGWSRHWIEAVTYDVGRPKGRHTVFATGSDPSDPSLTYKVYARQYDNALVLFKPLSYTRGETGTLATSTATTHRLDGWYRPVRADGSLGLPIRDITLRNGEGAILAKVT